MRYLPTRYHLEQLQAFRAATLDALETEYGADARAAAEEALSHPGVVDLIGVAIEIGLEPRPANATPVARSVADRMGFDPLPPVTERHRAAEGL